MVLQLEHTQEIFDGESRADFEPIRPPEHGHFAGRKSTFALFSIFVTLSWLSLNQPDTFSHAFYPNHPTDQHLTPVWPWNDLPLSRKIKLISSFWFVLHVNVRISRFSSLVNSIVRFLSIVITIFDFPFSRFFSLQQKCPNVFLPLGLEKDIFGWIGICGYREHGGCRRPLHFHPDRPRAPLPDEKKT